MARKSNLDEMGMFLERLRLPKHFEKEVATWMCIYSNYTYYKNPSYKYSSMETQKQGS